MKERRKMSDKPVEPINQETEASSTPEAATKSIPKGLALSIVILTTLLGCFIPNIVVNIQENLYQKIFSPPEKAVEILTGDTAKLYVRTEAGRVFFCDVYEKPSPCKEIALESVPKAQTLEPTPSRSSFSSPPAPGKVIASHESYIQYIDGSSSARWVILDDGSVWVWRSTCAMFGCTSLPLTGMLLGASLGFLAGVIIVEAIRKSQRETRQGK
jgi:hypothetical protein